MSDIGRSIGGSFRDPSGYLFYHQGFLYRRINPVYAEHYDQLISSGLYDVLTGKGLLIPHEEVDLDLPEHEDAYRILHPQEVPFISYPYEWCFSQWKDAALVTLKIQREALDRGLILKDASAFNVQFLDGRPVFIDTLSFEKYTPGTPWVAYKQFCEHFLAPLTLMAYRDVRLGQLMRLHIGGIPLDLATSLLPSKTRLNPGLLMHLHVHAGSQRKYAGKKVNQTRQISWNALAGLIESLQKTVEKLNWSPVGTTWADYYEETNYTATGETHKRELVEEFLEEIQPESVWDMGANVGTYSRLATIHGALTIALDVDPAAVEKNYRTCVREGETHLLPLLCDLSNPSPGLGWAHQERFSLAERGKTDTVMALALVHHLAISNNVPLDRLAEFFARLGEHLIIEFIPKSDDQLQRLLVARKDVFADYSRENFEKAFSRYYQIRTAEQIRETERTLYLMKQHANYPTRHAGVDRQ
jgi:ribosomal protein L11 methylase PrmA